MDLEHLPQSPGVYLMRDTAAKIIYIGKAKNLKKRVASYFKKNPSSPKSAALVATVKKIDYIPTQSERECLLLEQKLIRRVKPLYNTTWRDDKSYPYIKLTLNEDFPRLIWTRKKKRDGAHYFGPYPQVTAIRKLVHTLWKKRIAPLRPCKFEFKKEEISCGEGLKEFNPSLYRKVQSCIYLHTGECAAPCVGKISRPNYLNMARKADLFLKGNLNPLKKTLEQEMREASKLLKFEKAQEIKEQLQALHFFREKVSLMEVNEERILEQTNKSQILTDLQKTLGLPRPPLRIEGFDISNIQTAEPVGSLVVFERGEPLKSDYRKFKIKTVQAPNDFASMSEVIGRHARHLRNGEQLPDLILIDGGRGQLNAAVSALGDLLKKIPVISLAKEHEEIYIPNRPEPLLLPLDSDCLHLLQRVRDEAHRFAITFHRTRRKKAFFSNV